jgi:hypothetical protein
VHGVRGVGEIDYVRFVRSSAKLIEEVMRSNEPKIESDFIKHSFGSFGWFKMYITLYMACNAHGFVLEASLSVP